MKKFSAFILSLIFLFLCGCDKNASRDLPKKEIEPVDKNINCVWIFYREISMEKEKGGTEKSFYEKINKMFDNCKKMGINHIFFHVRAFGDSFYPSKLFPWSKYLTGEQGKPVDYDPLKIAVEAAHSKNLYIHAWINPFRISFSKNINDLCADNPCRKLVESDDDCIAMTSEGIYFNPSSSKAHSIIINGVREIVKNYDVDGVHIDDYFYPGTDKNIDGKQYEKYTSSGGKMDLSQWRIQCVSSFVSGLYSAVKNKNQKLIFSISPAGNIYNNYNSLFADVVKWGNTDGCCDWLIPQLYYGFENDTLPYDKACDEWREKINNKNVKLIAGIGAYKAAEPETDEWKNKEIISRQLEYARKKNYDGYSFFSYSSLMKINFRLAESLPESES